MGSYLLELLVLGTLLGLALGRLDRLGLQHQTKNKKEKITFW